MDPLHTLSSIEIDEFVSRCGANKRDVRTFLDTVGQSGTEEIAMLNLYYDARLYGWDILAIWAIEAGIRLAYADKVSNAKAIFNKIETPLPGGPYSILHRSRR